MRFCDIPILYFQNLYIKVRLNHSETKNVFETAVYSLKYFDLVDAESTFLLYEPRVYAFVNV